MSEEISNEMVAAANVVNLGAAREARARQPVQYLTDEERQSVRRLLAMKDRIIKAVEAIETLSHACPTAKRELRALALELKGDA